MTRPLSQIISLAATPYYHCVPRCVRRAFLCGEDRYSGKNFDHRKPWVVNHLTLLGKILAIAIAACACTKATHWCIATCAGNCSARRNSGNWI